MSERVMGLLDRLPAMGHTYREAIYDCRNHLIHLWRVVPGDWVYPHTHPETDDIWYVVEGNGEYYLSAGKKQKVAAGDLLLASPCEVHGMHNTGEEDIVILSILAPLPVEYAEAPGFEYPGE